MSKVSITHVTKKNGRTNVKMHKVIFVIVVMLTLFRLYPTKNFPVPAASATPSIRPVIPAIGGTCSGGGYAGMDVNFCQGWLIFKSKLLKFNTYDF